MIGDDEVSAVTAEVARRQSDGKWKYIIDNPDAAGILAVDLTGSRGRDLGEYADLPLGACCSALDKLLASPLRSGQSALLV